MDDRLKDAVITGAAGMVGSYIGFGTLMTRDALDVTDLSAVRDFCRTRRSKLIVHLAAATDLVACEKDPAGTYLTNAIGTYNMALMAREMGAKFVYVSTSAVFDGKKDGPYRESDLPNPQTQYGHSKYLGELAVESMLDDYLILRTCWIFGGGPARDHKFVANIMRQLNHPTIDVIGDKRGSPTYGKDLVAALVRLVREDARGLYHVGNQGSPTRVDIAREITAIMGSSVKIVEADAVMFEAAYPGAAARGNESIASDKIVLRPWQDALREYLESEWGAILPG